MKTKRTNQRKILEIMGVKEPSSKDSAEKMACFKCNKLGHKQADCPNKSTGGGKKSHGTQATPPPRCPACASNHSSKDAKGKTWFKSRLSACSVFRSKTPEERAAIVTEAEGCSLCLDWTGEHKATKCKSTTGKGQSYEACIKPEGAGVCGKPHNTMLHGSTNRYCNSARRIVNVNQGGPRFWGRGEPGAPSSADLREADEKHSLFQYQD